MILHGRGLSPGFFEGRAHVLDAAAWIAAARNVTAARGQADAAVEYAERVNAPFDRCHQLSWSSTVDTLIDDFNIIQPQRDSGLCQEAGFFAITVN